MVGEISNSEMRGKNVTKGMFDIHYSLEEEEKKESRRESCRESDQQIRSCCRERKKFVPVVARDSSVPL